MGEMVGTPRMIKLLNKDVIEGIIKVNGPITKPEIAKLTNLSLVTVNKTVDILVSENKVRLSDVHDSSVGRRAQYFEINEELHYIIGLHYDCNMYIGAVSNSIGKIIFRREFPVRVSSYGEVMEDTYSALDSLCEFCTGHEIAAIGLGVPGVVKEGVVTNIPNIPSWEGVDVAHVLEERYGAPVLLENDINLAAMGVYYGQYKDKVDSLALVYLEQGIGSGLILGRELFKGATNFAGELSYLPVDWGMDGRNAVNAAGAQPAAGSDARCSGAQSAAGSDARYNGAFEHTVIRLEEELRQSSGTRKKELKSLLRRTVANGLLSIICVINPEVVGLVCSQITRTDIKGIEELLKDCIGEEHVPKLMKLDDIREPGIHGLIGMCIREITPTYSLSSRKRG